MINAKSAETSNTLYYTKNQDNVTSITSIRINSDLYRKAKNYMVFDKNFTLSNFVHKALSEFFEDENHLKNLLKRSKNEQKMIQKRLKMVQKLQEIHQNKHKNLKKSDIVTFQNELAENLNTDERGRSVTAFWKETIRILSEKNGDSSIFKGRYAYYSNFYNDPVTYQGFMVKYNLALNIFGDKK